MTTRPLILMAVLFGLAPLLGVTACGGTMRPPDQLADDHAGSWPGLFTFSTPGNAPRTYEGALLLSVSTASDRAVDIGPLCHNGTGFVTAMGFDGVYQWDGAFKCENLTTLDGCVGIELTYSKVRVEVAGNVLKMHAEGRAMAGHCEYSVPTVVGFEGTRPTPTPESAH